MKIVSRLVFCFGVALSHFSYGQMDKPYIPPSPNAAALARQASISVGYYTGVQDVSYPFPTMGGKDISVPISIDYHASGVKIQDVASSVGLGFNLNAGGMVTRVVRGVPDGSKPRCSTQITDFLANADGDCDGEHDVFLFNVGSHREILFE